ncbi:(2Fe-2S)-binding protein [Sphingomonas immobilis]|uniref:Bacterioferritin-associated ferredoxin n=1 Tax=Sphingomonas immobilis TaxID=3063997 RepID=A0ABT8ZZ83_9SPHN|nr:(2Fe-2S)-binding protein [Sphingomonas sp. CA1-15]MDO7842434.1 (2Fe-2S)-binding protein [Sphingomonas sp. CA1-15]
MVVCICNAIRESDVRSAARNGCATPCQVHQAMGRPPKCGKCAAFTRTIIDAERSAA